MKVPKQINSVIDKKLLKEIAEIKRAFKHAEKIKTSKLNGRPVEELLNEI
jgi:hypothetical protein